MPELENDGNYVVIDDELHEYFAKQLQDPERRRAFVRTLAEWLAADILKDQQAKSTKEPRGG